MKKNGLLLSAALVSLLSMVSAVHAQEDGNSGWHEGWGEHHHGSECANRLPDAKAKLLHEAMRAVYQKDRPLMEKKHNLYKDVRNELKAEPFNEKAYLHTESQLDALKAQIREDKLKALADVLAQLSPAEREIAMRMHHHHWHKHWHMHHEASWQDHHEAGPGEQHEWHKGQDGQEDHDMGYNQTSPNEAQSNPIAEPAYPPYSSR